MKSQRTSREKETEEEFRITLIYSRFWLNKDPLVYVKVLKRLRYPLDYKYSEEVQDPPNTLNVPSLNRRKH